MSLTEALDLITPSGRAMAGMLLDFAEFEREVLRARVRAGIARDRKEGQPHGRPRGDRPASGHRPDQRPTDPGGPLNDFP